MAAKYRVRISSISETDCYDHITPVLRNLHWRPVQTRITYKTLPLAYKALNGMAPVYISQILDMYKPSQTLRSAHQNLLLILRSNTATYGDGAFSICAGPKVWNSLPGTITKRRAES